MTMGMQAIAQDEFTKCFEPKPIFTLDRLLSLKMLVAVFLLPLYIFGIFFRYFVLFPLKVCVLCISLILFLTITPLLTILRLDELKREFFVVICKMWAFSVFAVTRHHGVKPRLSEPHLFVANHTTFLDYVLLSAHQIPHAIVAQTHGGFFSLIQQYILAQMGSMTFQRKEKKDRQKLAEKLKHHVHTQFHIAPILIFPEGTCVNNEYTVLFHKGAFELGATVCPVAIKYNKMYYDPYWNTRESSFLQHVGYLMTRWFLSVDIWWLPPQRQLPEESPIVFANRVKDMISQQAGLQNLSWDGYMKNFLEAKEQAKLQKISQESYVATLKGKLERLTPPLCSYKSLEAAEDVVLKED